jgi:replicative DNA helicase
MAQRRRSVIPINRDADVQKSLGEMLNRTPPSDAKAEMSVLGSILLDPHRIDEVSDMARAEDFYDETHRITYEEMLCLHDKGKKVDAVLLRNALKKHELFKRANTNLDAYLLEVAESVPHAASAVYYAEIVSDKSALRRLIGASEDTMVAAYTSRDPVSEQIALAESRVFTIQEDRIGGEAIDLRTAMAESFAELASRERGKKPGVPTGYEDLDRITGGLPKGGLVILAARTSMGKTAFAMNLAMNVAKRDEGVLFVSLEMNWTELLYRVWSRESQVSLSRIRDNMISDRERDHMVEAQGRLCDKPLHVFDRPMLGMSAIAAQARRLKRRKNLRLVVIDYLQLIQPEDRRDNREQQVAKASRRAKCLAGELEVPVLMLSQLNREVEKTPNGDTTPKLSHLRESGAIEQDADIVMFVHNPEYYKPAGERVRTNGAERTGLIIAKQRNGETGMIPLDWIGHFQTFVDVEDPQAKKDQQKSFAEKYTCE